MKTTMRFCNTSGRVFQESGVQLMFLLLLQCRVGIIYFSRRTLVEIKGVSASVGWMAALDKEDLVFTTERHPESRPADRIPRCRDEGACGINPASTRLDRDLNPVCLVPERTPLPPAHTT